MFSEVIVTAYRSVPAQTDNTPFHTSTGDHVKYGGVALSRDLLCGACRKLHKRCQHPEYPKRLHYGDWVYIPEIGFLQVNDVMGAYSTQRINGRKKKVPLVNRVDIWVPTYAHERRFDKEFRDKRMDLYKVQLEER